MSEWVSVCTDDDDEHISLIDFVWPTKYQNETKRIHIEWWVSRESQKKKKRNECQNDWNGRFASIYWENPRRNRSSGFIENRSNPLCTMWRKCMWVDKIEFCSFFFCFLPFRFIFAMMAFALVQYVVRSCIYMGNGIRNKFPRRIHFDGRCNSIYIYSYTSHTNTNNAIHVRHAHTFIRSEYYCRHRTNHRLHNVTLLSYTCRIYSLILFVCNERIAERPNETTYRYRWYTYYYE